VALRGWKNLPCPGGCRLPELCHSFSPRGGVEWSVEELTMSKEDRIRRMKVQHQAEGYLELGLPQQALDALGRLGTAGKADARTLHLQGEALRSLERYADAIVPLRKVAELEPENVEVLLALGWCHKRTGRIDLAIGALDAALAADGDEPLIRYNLACYHSVAGDKRSALACLEQALSLDANYRLLIDHEPDFDPLRADPEFQAVCEGARTPG
jgi:Flp pilus assembly protein TadD